MKYLNKIVKEIILENLYPNIYYDLID